MSYELVDIDAGNFIDSYRNIGYSLKTAIADIIDNSIFAGASVIDVNFIWDYDLKHQPVIQIVDNGHGMTGDELKEAMRLACKSPEDFRDARDLGRFGLGLKSASFSQCRILTVLSRKKGHETVCRRWNIDHIKETHRFELETLSAEESGIDFDETGFDEGTIVQWDSIDKLDFRNFNTEEARECYWLSIMEDVNRHLAETFGSFAGQIEFHFNGNPLELWDPFLTSLGSTIIERDAFMINGKKISTVSYVLPEKLSDDKYYLGSSDKGWSDQQGFYLYRNNRLIVAGSWLNIPKLPKREAYRLARIRIDIGNDLDEEWHIDIKKETAVCPPELKDYLQKKAQYARTQSAGKFRSRGKTLRRSVSKNQQHGFIWQYGLKKDLPFYQIDELHPLVKEFCNELDDDQEKKFKKLLAYISNSLPVMSIVTSEADAKGKMIHNDACDLSDEELAQSYISAVESEMEFNEDGYSYPMIAEFIAGTEPFTYCNAVVQKVRKEKGWEM